MVLEGLKPKSIWHIFEHILAKTPRPSKSEDQIRDEIRKWIRSIADNKSLDIQMETDEIGNLFVKIPATADMEGNTPLLLQVHMDMVCETDRPEGFDFDKSPIPIRVQDNGKWVDADGTTLGADDGIGVAMVLALINENSEEFSHGPLEILFTVDEETGLTGAFELNPEKLDINSKHLINVDSEDLGIITIGSAGGGDIIFTMAFDGIQLSDLQDIKSIAIDVNGLLGGHSGVDIHKSRANAIKIIGEILSEVDKHADIWIQEWNGGNKHNAIPRESKCKFSIISEKLEPISQVLNEEISRIQQKYTVESKIEPHIQIKWQEVDQINTSMSKELSSKLIQTVVELPHGVIAYSPEIPDLVETSNNLAIIKTDEPQIEIVLSSRSNKDEKLKEIRNNIEQTGGKFGWNVQKLQAYPGWTPDPDNDFLAYVKTVYSDVYGSEVHVEAVHAGLETSVIGSKIPGIKMISIGPTVENPHTPQERVNIDSVAVLYAVLKQLISQFK